MRAKESDMKELILMIARSLVDRPDEVEVTEVRGDKTTVLELKVAKEDLGGFGETEQKILQQVCNKHKVPQLLVSKLLNAEFETQGMTRHSKVFGKIDKILREEWRDDYDEIMKDMIDERKEKDTTK